MLSELCAGFDMRPYEHSALVKTQGVLCTRTEPT